MNAKVTTANLLAFNGDFCQALGSFFNDPTSSRTIGMIKTTREQISLTSKDLSTLRNGCWLNDTIIQAYLQLISQRSVDVEELEKVIFINEIKDNCFRST
jgi:hypothetical protein